MSKRTVLNDDAPTAKHIRIDEGSQCQSWTAPLADERAWRILEEFLTTDMTYPLMEEAFLSYLGNQYSEDDWKESHNALFSGDGDDKVALENLWVVKAKHMPLASCAPKDSVTDRPAKFKNPYLNLDAKDDDDEEAQEQDNNNNNNNNNDNNNDNDGLFESCKVTHLPGSSSAARFAAVIDHLANRFEDMQSNSSQDNQLLPSSISGLITLALARSQDERMYLLHVQYYITSTPSEGELSCYSVGLASRPTAHVADSSKTIAESLSFSLYLAIKQYVRISDEECEVVKQSCRKFPNPVWVRFKHDKYKGDIAQVFDSDLPDDFVTVLVPPQEFPYPMSQGSRSLLDQSRLLTGDAVTDIKRSEEVVGCKYKGERYYMGLLLKNVHRDRLECVVCPHADDIQLHLQCRWDQAFLKTTVVACSKQFLRVGDMARIVKGDLSSGIGQVVLTNHPTEDIEHVFQVGDTVRVVAGPYLGVEGHIIQMADDVFRLCQDISKEEVEVSKYYLDHHPLSHTLQARLPMQQLFNPPSDIESIQKGDHIEVLMGQHIGKSGIVHWLPKAGNDLWFQDGSSIIPVPIVAVWQIHNLQTLQYTQDKGYDVKPGDVMRVAHGPEYPMKGVM
ncbi:hypothetical protein BDR07DRAFT_1482164 [Suillus spraguei]|nr:hypothetical protein BDR07DRAFT_1482164 [Suillus spraguei]